MSAQPNKRIKPDPDAGGPSNSKRKANDTHYDADKDTVPSKHPLYKALYEHARRANNDKTQYNQDLFQKYSDYIGHFGTAHTPIRSTWNGLAKKYRDDFIELSTQHGKIEVYKGEACKKIELQNDEAVEVVRRIQDVRGVVTTAKNIQSQLKNAKAWIKHLNPYSKKAHEVSEAYDLDETYINALCEQFAVTTLDVQQKGKGKAVMTPAMDEKMVASPDEWFGDLEWSQKGLLKPVLVTSTEKVFLEHVRAKIPFKDMLEADLEEQKSFLKHMEKAFKDDFEDSPVIRECQEAQLEELEAWRAVAQIRDESNLALYDGGEKTSDRDSQDDFNRLVYGRLLKKLQLCKANNESTSPEIRNLTVELKKAEKAVVDHRARVAADLAAQDIKMRKSYKEATEFRKYAAALPVTPEQTEMLNLNTEKIAQREAELQQHERTAKRTAGSATPFIVPHVPIIVEDPDIARIRYCREHAVYLNEYYKVQVDIYQKLKKWSATHKLQDSGIPVRYGWNIEVEEEPKLEVAGQFSNVAVARAQHMKYESELFQDLEEVQQNLQEARNELGKIEKSALDKMSAKATEKLRQMVEQYRIPFECFDFTRGENDELLQSLGDQALAIRHRAGAERRRIEDRWADLYKASEDPVDPVKYEGEMQENMYQAAVASRPSWLDELEPPPPSEDMREPDQTLQNNEQGLEPVAARTVHGQSPHSHALAAEDVSQHIPEIPDIHNQNQYVSHNQDGFTQMAMQAAQHSAVPENASPLANALPDNSSSFLGNPGNAPHFQDSGAAFPEVQQTIPQAGTSNTNMRGYQCDTPHYGNDSDRSLPYNQYENMEYQHLLQGNQDIAGHGQMQAGFDPSLVAAPAANDPPQLPYATAQGVAMSGLGMVAGRTPNPEQLQQPQPQKTIPFPVTRPRCAMRGPNSQINQASPSPTEVDAQRLPPAQNVGRLDTSAYSNDSNSFKREFSPQLHNISPIYPSNNARHNAHLLPSFLPDRGQSHLGTTRQSRPSTPGYPPPLQNYQGRGPTGYGTPSLASPIFPQSQLNPHVSREMTASPASLGGDFQGIPRNGFQNRTILRPESRMSQRSTGTGSATPRPQRPQTHLGVLAEDGTVIPIRAEDKDSYDAQHLYQLVGSAWIRLYAEMEM